MQRFKFHRQTIFEMLYMGELGQKLWKSNTCPLKKPEFSNIFAKISPVLNFQLPEKTAAVKYAISKAAKQQTIGSSNYLCGKRA